MGLSPKQRPKGGYTKRGDRRSSPPSPSSLSSLSSLNEVLLEPSETLWNTLEPSRTLKLCEGLMSQTESPFESISLTLLSLKLQIWLSSQNWSEFNQEFISEVTFLLGGGGVRSQTCPIIYIDN